MSVSHVKPVKVLEQLALRSSRDPAKLRSIRITYTYKRCISHTKAPLIHQHYPNAYWTLFAFEAYVKIRLSGRLLHWSAVLCPLAGLLIL